VADSGKPFAIVRAFGTERVADGAEAGPFVRVAGLGSVPTSDTASKAQASCDERAERRGTSNNDICF
jgi:hypothetical protein